MQDGWTSDGRAQADSFPVPEPACGAEGRREDSAVRIREEEARGDMARAQPGEASAREGGDRARARRGEGRRHASETHSAPHSGGLHLKP